MTTLTRHTRTFILLLIVVYAAFGADLTAKQRSKLHPLFRSLITNSSQPLLKTSSRSHRIASTVSSDGTLRYGAIVYTRNVEEIRSMGIHVNSVLPEFVTAQLTPSDMVRLADLESVKFLDPGKVHHPLLDVSVPETGAALLHSGFINNTPYKGAGAIVLIYDTGIDWKHFDFRKSDTTKSRILFIWDQTLTAGVGESAPSGFSYGVEYTQAQIENELKGNPPGVVHEKDIIGHGTHVASTAAGNGQAFNNKYVGMAPEADIIIVKGGEGSFSSIGEIDGLTYAQNKATALKEPIVVNMSLGGQEGSHDGTNDDEVAVTKFVQTPGRAVCIAAGNDGSDMIHANGTVSNGSPSVITVNVPQGYTPNTGTDNAFFILDIWLPNSNAVNMTITSPTKSIYSTPTDSELDSLKRPEGTIDTWNYIEQQNQHRHIQVWIHDAASPVPQSGQWTITLSTTGTSTTYDAWLDSELGDLSATITGGNNNRTVAMPGTAVGAITVGSYVTKWSWTDYTGVNWYYDDPDRTGNISTFSSIGPTADGRNKPDIAAPGQGIVAAFSSTDIDESTSDIIISNKYLLMQGTSMATPHVTGGVALLLSAKPSLTIAQIKNYLLSTARTDNFTTSSVWNATWGNGKMDIYKAMASAVGASGANRTILSYYSGAAPNYTAIPSPNQKVAMRFTPTTTGKLASVSVNINSGSSGVTGTGNLKVTATQSIAGSLDGIPGTQIGNSVLIPFSSLSPGVANVIDFSSAGVFVTSGTDFQIVLELTKVGDTLQLALDDGSLHINRTSSYRTGANGVLGWYNRADPNYTSSYTPTYYNLVITADIAVPVTDVERISSALPTSFMLKQNYPNPFNPTTKITYTIPTASKVTLKIYNLLGQLVATLVDEQQEANTYVKEFDASRLASGTYFYQINAGNFNSTKKMILMK
jgi:minor extracellular serine protease Vpr